MAGEALAGATALVDVAQPGEMLCLGVEALMATTRTFTQTLVQSSPPTRLFLSCFPLLYLLGRCSLFSVHMIKSHLRWDILVLTCLPCNFFVVLAARAST